jgi:hypothetical protein
MCGESHLPDDGGVYDQDYATLRTMRALGNVHGLITRIIGMKGAEIHRLTESDRRLVRYLRDEGIFDG